MSTFYAKQAMPWAQAQALLDCRRTCRDERHSIHSRWTSAYHPTPPAGIPRQYRAHTTPQLLPCQASRGQPPCWTRRRTCPHRAKAHPHTHPSAHTRQTARRDDATHRHAHLSTTHAHPHQSTRTSQLISMAARDLARQPRDMAVSGQAVLSDRCLLRHCLRAARDPSRATQKAQWT